MGRARMLEKDIHQMGIFKQDVKAYLDVIPFPFPSEHGVGHIAILSEGVT